MGNEKERFLFFNEIRPTRPGKGVALGRAWKQRNSFDSRSMGQGEEQQKDLITVFTLEEPLVLKGRKQAIAR